MDWLMLLKAFVIGGVICVIGQLWIDLTAMTPARILVLFVVMGVVLTAIGLYEPIVEFAGGTVTERGKYPGWQYERDSQFRDMVLEAYHDLTGKEGVVEATHGGLECGLLIEKIPGLDAISMGPELHDVHSVRERLSVPSTERMYELLCEALKRSK